MLDHVDMGGLRGALLVVCDLLRLRLVLNHVVMEELGGVVAVSSATASVGVGPGERGGSLLLVPPLLPFQFLLRLGSLHSLVRLFVSVVDELVLPLVGGSLRWELLLCRWWLAMFCMNTCSSGFVCSCSLTCFCGCFCRAADSSCRDAAPSPRDLGRKASYSTGTANKACCFWLL
jgi:hypothetical protein